MKRKVSEVMTKEKLITAPEGTDLAKAENILRNYKIEKLPVVSKQGKLVGLITYRDILQLTNNPNAVKDSYGRLLVGAALGITNDLMNRADALIQVGVDVVTLDSAHGHSKGVIEALKALRNTESKESIIENIYKYRPNGFDDPHNMVRNLPNGLKTGCQYVIDPQEKTFNFYTLPYKVRILGYKCNVVKPRLKLNLFRIKSDLLQ